MQKINFQNLPNTTTPVNATNLNAIQDNTENAITAVQTTITGIQQDITSIRNYSTTEQVIGRWIDNKPLYRKVYTGTTSNITDGYFTFTDAGLKNMEQLIKFEYFIKDGTVFIKIPNVGDRIANTYIQTSYGGIGMIVQSGSYYSNFSNKPYTVILEYTKTTD